MFSTSDLHRRIVGRLAVVAALVLAGCATSGPNPDVERARASYEAASVDADINKYASVPLYEAGKWLEQAEKAAEKDDLDEATHLASVTERRVEIARVVAATARTQDEIQMLYEERDRLRLQARSAAVERATARADAAEAALAELEAKKTDRGMILTLGDVLFDVGKATLQPGAEQTLYRLVEFLRENPDREILVEGHTDSTGSEGFNMVLSQQRADAVAAFVMRNGISGLRILSRGYGWNYPVATNESAAGRQRNRRVEIVILNPGEKARDRALSSPGGPR